MSNSAVTKLNAFEVRFDGFEGLPSRKGQGYVHSPEFTCFGHQWCLRLWPGGNSSSGDGKVAVYLCHKSGGSIEVQVSFAVKKSKAEVAAYFCMGAQTYEPKGALKGNWGTHNFADHTAIIEALQDGALVIDVNMKQTGKSTSTASYVPANPFCQNALEKFLDEESADVVFDVSTDHLGGERRTRKRAKTSPTTFHAHRFVIPKNGALAEACETSHDLTPIPINGISPEIFSHLLYYLYGGAMDDDELKENAKDIIDAADRFGIVGLKLEAEAAYASSAAITIDNAVDNLLYADAKNCALLKESVMDFLVQNGTEAVQKLSFDNVPSYLMKDLLTAMTMEKKEVGATEDSSDFATARVGALRQMLHEKGLEVDGSREVMIARLEAHSSD